MGAHELEQLLGVYGYALVFVIVALQGLCLPLPGTTALIAAALYAGSTHHLAIAGVIAAGALGALAGTAAGFLLGRWAGERLIARLARLARARPERVAGWQRAAGRESAKLVFFGRWITGLRNIAGLVSGAAGMPVLRFLIVSAAAATLWATSAGLEYYYFGRALQSADIWVQITLAAAWIASTALWLGFVRRRARAAQLRGG
jgi:membrane protein DedA with SNARE-associated domain